MNDLQCNNLIAWSVGLCLVLLFLPFWLLFIIGAAIFYKGKPMKLPFNFYSNNRHFDKWEAEELARVKKARKDFAEYREVLMSEKELREFEAFKNRSDK